MPFFWRVCQHFLLACRVLLIEYNVRVPRNEMPVLKNRASRQGPEVKPWKYWKMNTLQSSHQMSHLFSSLYFHILPPLPAQLLSSIVHIICLRRFSFPLYFPYPLISFLFTSCHLCLFFSVLPFLVSLPTQLLSLQSVPLARVFSISLSSFFTRSFLFPTVYNICVFSLS